MAGPFPLYHAFSLLITRGTKVTLSFQKGTEAYLKHHLFLLPWFLSLNINIPVAIVDFSLRLSGKIRWTVNDSQDRE